MSKALQIIWRTWEKGEEKLNYQGKHYNFSLMTPEFSPKPAGLPMIPVMIAAVGPVMQKTAARLCGGVLAASFATRKYLEEECWSGRRSPPRLQARGKNFEHFEVTGGGFIATGPDDGRR